MHHGITMTSATSFVPSPVKFCRLKHTSWERSFGYQVYRRSRALKDVPGPECNSVLGLLHLLGKRDMHRVCTEHAETYGPIFKWRLFTFHVGSPF